MGNRSKRLATRQLQLGKGLLVFACLIASFLLLSTGIAYADDDHVMDMTTTETLSVKAQALISANDSAENASVAYVTPQVRTEIENGQLERGEFSFSLVDSAGAQLETATNDDDGNVNFSQLSFVPDDLDIDVDTGEPVATTFTYLVSELPGDDPTIIYDTAVVRICVTVTPGQDGALEAQVAYAYLNDQESPQDTDDPTFMNRYVTTAIRFVIRDSYNPYDKIQGAHYGLWILNYNGSDIYLGLGRNQKAVEGCEYESSDDGSIWWDMPIRSGITYYLLEEWPPPAGRLVDPYPSEYFQLVYDEESESGSYRVVYESEMQDEGHPSGVGRHSKGETSEDSGGSAPANDSPANADPASTDPASNNTASSSGNDKVSQPTTVATSRTSAQKLPATSDAACGNPAAMLLAGVLLLFAGSSRLWKPRC